MKKGRSFLFFVLAVGIAVVGSGIYVFQGIRVANGEPITKEMVMGESDAPITIIEFASLTCPHCARFHSEILPRIKSGYIDTGKAKLIFRDFPFDQRALMASAMARCGSEEQYFGFLDILFRTQMNWAKADDTFEALAQIGRMGGLSRDSVDACLHNEELRKAIVAGRLSGEQEFDIDSTPTFIINGTKHEGVKSFEEFRSILDDLVPNT